MQDRDGLMRRIKKLLALAADNPDSPESQAAGIKAGQLMSEYQIEFASIEMEEDEILQDEAAIYMEEDVKWNHSLVTVISETFNCKSIKSGNTFKIIGYKHDVELTKWMFSYVRTIIAKKADKFCSTQKQRKDFGMGAVISLNRRFKEIFSVKKQHMDGATSALVVQKDGKVDAKYHELFPSSRKTTPKFNMNGHYHKGKEVGESISLSKPVNGGKSSQSALN